jgi:hypothetical protein
MFQKRASHRDFEARNVRENVVHSFENHILYALYFIDLSTTSKQSENFEQKVENQDSSKSRLLEVNSQPLKIPID